jgi:stress response protein YsnF
MDGFALAKATKEASAAPMRVGGPADIIQHLDLTFGDRTISLIVRTTFCVRRWPSEWSIKRMGAAMYGHVLVAVYPSRSDAERAYDALIRSGIGIDNVRMNEPEGSGRSPWHWLFGSAIPDSEKERYRAHFAQKRSAVSVFVDGGQSGTSVRGIEEILERYRPVDVHFEEEGMPGAAAAETTQGEQVIPLPKEELKVGKRVTDTVRHIRTHVVEEPVEKDVTLQDERMVVERRPATSRTGGALAEKDYEIHERHEEPVIEKATRIDEELVVRKEARERTEHVRDKVRRTRADVEKVGANEKR